jgi:spore germination protein
MQMTEQKAPALFDKLMKQFGPSDDIIQAPLHINDQYAFLFYIKTVVDGDRLQQAIIKPFFEMGSETSFASYIQSLPNNLQLPDMKKLLIQISAGFVLIAIGDQIYLLDIRLVKNNEVQDTLMEPTIHGPQLALSEDIETTITLIRQRYHLSTLKVEVMDIGANSNQTISLLFDSERVNSEILKKIKKKLKQTDTLFQSAGELQHFLNEGKYTILPSSLITERPDRVVYNILGGKVIIAIDGSPNVIITPVIFFDFMTSMEDNYHVFGVTAFTVILRYVGMLTCILLPSVYIAMTSYNPDVLRVELALTVAGSRVGVPYPSFIEVLFMLFFMELITEASMRLPKTISATATTVGGLILGTAATEAALTSTIMIIIISAVAISTFVIPINEMSFATRLLRLFLIVYTTLFGMVGLLVGFLGIIMVLVNKDSMGIPYLRIPWANTRAELRMDNNK